MCGSRDYRIGSLEKVDYTKSARDGLRPAACISGVEISVREARIDALQLIRSLTNPIVSPTATTPHKSKKQRRRRNLHTTSTTDLLSSRAEASPQELAMQFELDVSVEGREYTVVRSLYRMRQLHDELVEESEHYEETLDDTCCNRHTVRLSIPEMPSLQENGSCTSFCVMQASLRSFAPALECWLKKIVRLIPTKDSLTLTHFLLEPVCFSHSGSGVQMSISVSSDSCRRFGSKLSSLESIEEIHDEHQEE